MKKGFGFGKSVALSFDKALAKLIAELQKEGFRVLTEIDVAATMKKKLDHNMPPYRILGACNPALARRALTADPGVGLLLSCNVVVRQDEAGTVLVEFLDPGMMGQMTDNPDVAPIGAEAREKLQKVMRAI